MIKVYSTKVLIEIIQEEEDRNYVVPDSSVVKSQVGKVSYAGEKCENTKQGDIVVFPEYGTTEMSIQGTTYIVCEEKELICKLEENE